MMASICENSPKKVLYRHVFGSGQFNRGLARHRGRPKFANTIPASDWILECLFQIVNLSVGWSKSRHPLKGQVIWGANGSSFAQSSCSPSDRPRRRISNSLFPLWFLNRAPLSFSAPRVRRPLNRIHRTLFKVPSLPPARLSTRLFPFSIPSSFLSKFYHSQAPFLLRSTLLGGIANRVLRIDQDYSKLS